MNRIKFKAKCPYCGFENIVEVKEGITPKWCSNCSKEIKYTEIEERREIMGSLSEQLEELTNLGISSENYSIVKELLLKMIDAEINEITKYKKDLESGKFDSEEHFDKGFAIMECNTIIFFL